MKYLYNLVNSLKENEVELARHLLAFPKAGKPSGKLELLLQSKAQPNAIAHLPAKYRQANRLESDLIHTLLLSDHSASGMSTLGRYKLKCHKLLAVASLLHVRGVFHTGYKLTRRAKQIAIDYELPSEIIAAIELEIMLQMAVKKMPDPGPILEELRKRQAVASSYLRGMAIGLQLIDSYHKHSNEEYLEKLNLLKAEADFNQLSRTRFMCYQIEFNHYFVNGMYPEALALLEHIFPLLRTDKAIHSKSSLAQYILYHATVLARLQQFEKAIPTAREALQLVPSGLANENYVLMQLFLFTIQTDQWTECADLIKMAYANKVVKRNPAAAIRWKFYEAVYLYRKNQYDKGIRLIEELIKFNDKKATLFLGIRYLEILYRISMKQPDVVASRILSFQYFTRGSTKKLSPRWAALSSCLKKVSTKSSLENPSPEIIAWCKDKLTSHEWDYDNFEPIRFETWLENRSAGSRRSRKTVR